MRHGKQLPRRELATGLGLVLAAAMLAVPGAATGVGAAAGDERPDWMPPGAGESAITETMLTATLLTGDRVWAEPGPDGQWLVTIDPEPREDTTAVFEHYQVDDQLYVIPSDAAPLVGDVLDLELFNITKLARYGYADGVSVIMTGSGGRRPVMADTGMSVTAQLSSIDATAATIAPDGRWWRETRPSGAADARTATAPLAAVDRVWLDEVAQVTLAESVPQVGAPQAWAAGYDGAGVTVAVLDSGIDDEHPDLAGKVAMAENFTGEPDASDGHGHGTHVAGTVAGTGAASGGSYTGVAPGAQLLNGKVCDASGSCQSSAIIAGMEWAAQHADVVNMSLGGGPTGGADPLSLALTQLTADHDVLFVTSAGNNGPGARTVGSPGSADAALAVGAVDRNDQLADFSSRGPRLGDWAIKPDVTAPGVAIAAPRADGTGLGQPVDEHYTRVSGTSMASPHVAGAAAILLQRDPDLTPQQLKAALVSTGAPNTGLQVYEQGGGRLDVPAALAVPVLATPATLSLGYFPYPHDEAEPAHADLTYTNRTDEPVTLELSLDVPGSDELLSLDSTNLVVEPGDAATTTVTVDVRQGEDGLYGGYLIAMAAGEVITRTPVGFHKEAEAYDLTIRGIDREGRPAQAPDTMHVLDVEDMTRLISPGNFFVDGVTRLRVPPGTYSVLGAISTRDDHGQFVQSIAFVGDPEVTVTGDTTMVVDAREASRITVDTPAHESVPQGGVSFGYWRSANQPGPFFNPTWLVQHAAQEYYAAPTDPVGLGEFEFHSRWRMAEPEALLDVVEPVETTLAPVLLRPPAVDGEHELRLVDAGVGAPEDYADRDVTGAVVLVERGPAPFVEQEQHAAAAGAAAVIVTNDVPGKLTGPLNVEEGSIPTLSLTRDEGDGLRSLLAAGDVTVRLAGTAWSPFVYHLPLFEIGRIPDDLQYVVKADQLATAEVAYHNDAPGHEMLEGRHFSRPFHSGSILLHPSIDGPQTRTEYLIGDLSYQQTVYGERPFEARLREPDYIFYPAGETVHQSWFRQVMRPALLPEVVPTTRSGDSLSLSLFEWVDAAGNHFPSQLFGITAYPGDTVETRIWRSDELVGEIIDGFPRGSFPMTSEEADYRIELDVTREADWWTRSTETKTAWSFTSQRPDSGAELLPLLSIDYTVDLDLSNTAPHPRDERGPSTLELDVYHQDADLPAVDGARVWISFDDGDTWRPRPARAGGGGRFDIVLPGTGPAGSDALSLRVEAWDIGGNRIDQTIIRAWRLPDR